MSRLNYEYVKNEFNKIGYILLEDEYINSHTKMKYICPNHPNKISEICYNNLQQGKRCSYCSNNHVIKTISEVNEILESQDKNIVCVEYGGTTRTKSVFKCLIDDYQWSTSFDSIKNNNCGCPKCVGLDRIRTIDEVNQILLQQKKTIICTEYAGNVYMKNSKFKCLIDNYEWSTSFNNIKNNNRGCAKCSNVAKLKTIEDINLRLLEQNRNIVCIEYVGNVRNKSVFKCLDDGNVWRTTFNNIQNGQGCPRCSISKGERVIYNYLESINLQFKHQHKYKNCKYDKCLPFDFYIPIHNLCIEYQGEQHYFPVDFANRGMEWAENEFKLRIIRDKIKADYCLTNNINLLIIPYWEFDNIEKILNDRLNIQTKEGVA